jgi:hypothetical protein
MPVVAASVRSKPCCSASARAGARAAAMRAGSIQDFRRF